MRAFFVSNYLKLFSSTLGFLSLNRIGFVDLLIAKFNVKRLIKISFVSWLAIF